MRKMGMGKMGNSSQTALFFSGFSPISNQFHTFCRHFLECIFGNFSQFPISPHFPPFPPILPLFFHFPHFPEPLRLVA